MSNEKKISIEKVISDIKESNVNGKRKGCHGLHQCLSDDGYIRQIVCWTRITSPDRIDALVEHADKQNAEITALRTALTALTSQLESVVAENAALKAICDDRRTFIMNGVQLGYIRVPTVEADPALETIRVAVSPQESTPATDAFLAEVRASGIDQWITSRDGRWNGTTKEAERFASQLRQGGAV